MISADIPCYLLCLLLKNAFIWENSGPGVTNAGVYMRKMALNGYVLHVALAPVRDLVSLHRRCADHPNQAAIHANTAGVYPKSLDFNRTIPSCGARRRGLLDTFETGTFAGLCALHKYFLDEIYDFAGKMRTINIIKGGFRFAPVMYLEAALKDVKKCPSPPLRKSSKSMWRWMLLTRSVRATAAVHGSGWTVY